MKQIIGKKVGMTQVFSETDEFIPVTVIEAGPVFVTQVKSEEKEGYNALQVGFGDQKKHRVNKPKKGHFDKAGVSPKKVLKEFRMEDVANFELGQKIDVSEFEGLELVDVIGTSKGKGTAGPIKRWN